MYYTNAVRRGDNILVRGLSNGKPFKSKIPYKPTLFINTTDATSKYKDIYGKPCGAIKFDIKEISPSPCTLLLPKSVCCIAI